jgi:lysozyme family protein
VVNPIEVPAPPAIAKPAMAGNPAMAHKYPNLNYNMLIDEVMGAEGGYQNGANDHGGETKYGISKRSYPHLDIPNITQDMARDIFKKDFFDKISGDKLFEKNAGAAAHLADIAFNSGPGKAAQMLSDVLGIPRQKRITQEMIDMIPGDESIVKKLSARRSDFYNSLAANDPINSRNLRGWMNRLDRINTLVVSGMEGNVPVTSKKAAKQMQEAGKAFTAEANASISSAENKAVVDQINAIGRSVVGEDQEYIEATKEMSKKPISSIGDVFRATWDEHFLLNTNRGLDMLQKQNIIKASEANRKAMGDKFTKSWMETLTIGAVDGVNDLKAFEAEVREFKKLNPDVKLPYESSASVHELTLQAAKNIEEKYNQLNSGSFTGGIAEAANKLAHVALGYLPGHIAASLSDPVEAISMAAPNIAPIWWVSWPSARWRLDLMV